MYSRVKRKSRKSVHSFYSRRISQDGGSMADTEDTDQNGVSDSETMDDQSDLDRGSYNLCCYCFVNIKVIILNVFSWKFSWLLCKGLVLNFFSIKIMFLCFFVKCFSSKEKKYLKIRMNLKIKNIISFCKIYLNEILPVLILFF